MDSLQNICVEESTTVSEGIRKLDIAGSKIILVTNNGKLTGVVTDGDIRRWILKNGSFDAEIREMMHRSPRVVQKEELECAKQMMIQMRLEAIPVIDKNHIPVDVIFLHDIIGGECIKYKQTNLPVVIMAGGKGTRLYPYTNVLPKPLIPIGRTTIVERIIESFQKNGCKDFWLILNYKKALIKAYFAEKEHTYRIHYVEEEDFFGTCGSIGALKAKINEPFFVSNCDVLLDIDYSKLEEFHKKKGNEITCVTSLKHQQVPYGVLELERGGAIKKITEKPEFNYNVNTGIYIMEPTVFGDIPKGQVYHMTDLMNKLLLEHRKVGAYPVTDKCWQDMGEVDEMKKMIRSLQDC